VGELGFEVRIAVEKVWESAPHKGEGTAAAYREGRIDSG
jgi:hypothetical protein